MRHRPVSRAWLPTVAVVVVVCTVFLAPDCASACSCGVIAGVSQQEVVSGSDAVFAGEVVDIDDGSGPVMRSDAPETVTFRVLETWKGAGRETLEVKTAVSDISCGYPFNEDESYLVFASEGSTYGERDLEVALCGSTKPISEAGKALAALGPGVAPTVPPASGESLPDTSGAFPGLPPSILLFGTGAGALVLAAAFVRLVGGRRTRR